MNRTARWRYGLILLLVLLGVVYALPNIYGEDYAVQLSRKKSVTGVTLDVTKKQLESDIKAALRRHPKARRYWSSDWQLRRNYQIRVLINYERLLQASRVLLISANVAQILTWLSLTPLFALVTNCCSDSDISMQAGKGANNSPKVTIDVSGSSAPILLRMTQNNIGKPLAVVY